MTSTPFAGKSHEDCVRQALEYISDNFRDENDEPIYRMKPNSERFITDDRLELTDDFLRIVIQKILDQYVETDLDISWTTLEVKGNDFQILQ